MAIAASLLVSNLSAVDATSYTTASIAPTANQLVLGCVWNQAGAGVTTTIDSFSGGGLSSWTQVGTLNASEGGFPEQITVYRGMSASPGSGTVTINFGADTQQVIGWAFVQFSGVKTTGTDGADAVLQSKFQASNPSVTNPSITLNSATTAGNATFAVIGNSSGTKAITKGASYTELSNISNSVGGAITMESQFSAVNLNTANWTIASGGDCSLYSALELALATVTPAAGDDPPIGIIGRGAGW